MYCVDNPYNRREPQMVSGIFWCANSEDFIRPFSFLDVLIRVMTREAKKHRTLKAFDWDRRTMMILRRLGSRGGKGFRAKQIEEERKNTKIKYYQNPFRRGQSSAAHCGCMQMECHQRIMDFQKTKTDTEATLTE